MKVLITGACGFIGRNLVRELGAGHDLVLLDRIRPEEATVFSGDTRTLLPFETDWPFVKADITEPASILSAMEGVDAVIHLAGDPRGLPEIGVQVFRDNALGTFVVIDAAQQAGIKRFFCASSINAFGTFFWRLSGRLVPYTRLPLDEDFPPVPEDPYSLSKLVNEETCATYHRAYGMTTAAFRFAGVKPHQLYLEEVASGLPPTEAWSDGLYQWVHVADVVSGLRKALEERELPGFGVYTLGAGDTKCPEPTMELLQRFRPDLLEMVDPPLEGRAPLLSIERAQQTFGYSPTHRLGP